MAEPTDRKLLEQFARAGAENAFAALAARHVNLVYSAALRFTGDAHLAEEATQAVFIILARKAGGISSRVVLSGWLYQTARLASANIVRENHRRRQREQQAYMESTLNPPEPDSGEAWKQIAPVLDDAIISLRAADRDAILLRYFENKPLAEVGVALGVSEDAARVRVHRALEKLRHLLSKEGATLGATVIAGALGAHSVQAAPAAVAASLPALAGNSFSGTLTINALVQSTMKTMTWMKLKFALGLGMAAFLTGGVATELALHAAGTDALTAEQILKKSQEAYASMTSYSDDGKTVASLSGKTFTTTFNIKLERPDYYRIEWEQAVSPSYTSGGKAWSAGQGDFLELAHAGGPKKQQDKDTALAGATGVSGGAAATVPGTFFKMNWGNQLGGSFAQSKQLADEKVGDADCYVFETESKGIAQTLWIGKKDFLIHQKRSVSNTEAVKNAMEMAEKATGFKTPSSPQGSIVSTETHEHIVVNPKFTPADFER